MTPARLMAGLLAAALLLPILAGLLPALVSAEERALLADARASLCSLPGAPSDEQEKRHSACILCLTGCCSALGMDLARNETPALGLASAPLRCVGVHRADPRPAPYKLETGPPRGPPVTSRIAA